MVHSSQGLVIPTALVDRLSAATAGSRELDASIFRAFGGPLPTEFADHSISLTWQPDGSATMPVGGLQIKYTPPAYTASLDAALALAERTIGQRGPIDLSICGSAQVVIHHHDPCGNPLATAFGNTPPLALCIAILQALESSK